MTDHEKMIARKAWEAGFILCRNYGDNHAQWEGVQKERLWANYLKQAEAYTRCKSCGEYDGKHVPIGHGLICGEVAEVRCPLEPLPDGQHVAKMLARLETWHCHSCNIEVPRNERCRICGKTKGERA